MKPCLGTVGCVSLPGRNPMLDLTLTEELILPVPLERAHEICRRALEDLKWKIKGQSPTTILAQEGGIMKWVSNPNDFSVFLTASAEGTCVQLNVTWEYGKATGNLLQPVLQGKLNRVRDRIRSAIPGLQEGPTPPPLPGPKPHPPLPSPPPSPGPAKGRIFISYRRSDSADVTGRIRDRLVPHFGEGNVFLDVEDIPLGMDFAECIQNVVGECDAFLAIIGDKWINTTEQGGARRLDNPADHVRIEVESALQRKIPLIPVLVREAEMPGRDVLPESLRKLATRNAIRVRPNPDFHPDMTRLIEGLEELFKRTR